MIDDEQENYALGTANMVHADWDADVNPTQTGYSRPLPWSLGMIQESRVFSVISSEHRGPILKQLTLLLTRAWISLISNKQASGKAEVTAAGGGVREGEINSSMFSAPVSHLTQTFSEI